VNRPQRLRHTPKGRVITFYSYKGGTGRSMAMANVAWMLAMSGERVLIIDWDLEAPGLHRYFHPFLDDKDLTASVGLLDYVEKLRTRAAAKDELSPDDTDIMEYVKRLKWPPEFSVQWDRFGPFAGIDLLPAGQQGPAYSSKLNTFNWVEFYEKLGGSELLNMARQQLKSEYDYVLIDSRTGVSDTSGICTIEMPDTLVVCFTLNDQSIKGACGVAEWVQSKQKERALAASAARAAAAAAGKTVTRLPAPQVEEFPFRIYPVPTRVEIGSEKEKRQVALALAQQKFAPFLDHLNREDSASKYWGRVQLAYFAFYAFEEIPAIFGDTADEELSLSTPIKRIARNITGDSLLEPIALAEESDEAERLRKEILSWYIRKPTSTLLNPVQAAQRTYEELDRDSRLLMRAVMLRLVQIVPGAPPAPVTVPRDDFDGRLETMLQQLVTAGVVQISGSAGTVDKTVCESWDLLRQWIKEDEDFLLWRQSFIGSVSSWQRSGRDKSALLRGKILDDAVARLDAHPDNFTASERDFLASSRRESELATGIFVITVPFTNLRVQLSQWQMTIAGFILVAAFATFVVLSQQAGAKRQRSAAIVTLAEQYLMKDPLTAALLLTEVRDFDAAEANRKFALQVAANNYPERVIHSNEAFAALELAPDGDRFVTASDKGATLWFTANWERSNTVAQGDFIAASFNGWKPDRAKSRGRSGTADKLVTTSKDGVVRVWSLYGQQITAVPGSNLHELSTEPCVSKLKPVAYLGPLRYARFSPDEVVIVMAYEGGMLVMADAAKGTCFDVRLGPPYSASSPARSLATFDLDGEWAAINSNIVGELFHVQDWKVTPIHAHFDSPVAVSLTTQIMDLSSVIDAKTDVRITHPAAHVGAFSWDSNSIAGAYENRAWWQPVSGNQPAILCCHADAISAIAFDRSGNSVLTASKDKTIRVWPTQKKPLNPLATWPEIIDYLRSTTHACLSVNERTQLLNEDSHIAIENARACEARQR
jgi:MinD-like ATPase involved in chromosome partitioning or flagellar assembly/WD40 repeat protein